METKVCKDCQTEKELTEFYRFKQKRGDKTHEVTNSYCKPCHYQRTKDKAWESQIKTKYGLSETEYSEMLEAQNGLCLICQTEGKEDKRLSIDHSHKTKQVRGLLCQNCNVGLGKFQDDEKLLARAIEYLKTHN